MSSPVNVLQNCLVLCFSESNFFSLKKGKRMQLADGTLGKTSKCVFRLFVVFSADIPNGK